MEKLVVEKRKENKYEKTHFYVTCDNCHEENKKYGHKDEDIYGVRYKCIECQNYDLCEECFEKFHIFHDKNHHFQRLDVTSYEYDERKGIILDVGIRLMDNDFDQALDVLRYLVDEFLKKDEDKVTIGFCYRVIGEIYYGKLKKKEALLAFQKGLKFVKGVIVRELEIIIWISRVYGMIGEKKTSLKYLQIALKKCEKSCKDLVDLKCTILTDIALIYREIDQNETSLSYLFKIENIKDKIQQKKIYAMVLHEFALNYMTMCDYQKSLKYLKEALEWYNKFWDIQKNEKLAEIYLTYGQIYEKLGKYEKSLEMLDKGFPLTVDVYLKVKILIHKSSTLKEIGYFEKSSKCIIDAEDIIKCNKDTIDERVLSELSRDIAIIKGYSSTKNEIILKNYLDDIEKYKNDNDNFRVCELLYKIGTEDLVNEQKSLEYLYKCKNLCETFEIKSKGILSMVHSAIGGLIKNDIKLKLDHFNKARVIAAESGQKMSEMNSLISISDIFFKRKLFIEAIKFLERAFQLFGEMVNSIDSSNHISTFRENVHIKNMFHKIVYCYLMLKNESQALKMMEFNKTVELLMKCNTTTEEDGIKNISLKKAEKLSPPWMTLFLSYYIIPKNPNQSTLLRVISLNGRMIDLEYKIFNSNMIKDSINKFKKILSKFEKEISTKNEDLSIIDIDSDVLNKILEDLYDLLIRGLEGILSGFKKKFVIVPHDELFQVPFFALYDKHQKKYLIEKYQFHVTTSILMHKVNIDRQKENKVFFSSEKGVVKKTKGIIIVDPLGKFRLDNKIEGEEISKILNNSSKIDGKDTIMLCDDQATKKNVINHFTKGDSFRVIYFGTHLNRIEENGCVYYSNPFENPAKIRLAYDEELSIDELSQVLKGQPLKGTEIAILNCCSSGTFSLYRSLFEIGIPTVIVSLFDVDNIIGRIYSTKFFHFCYQKGLDKDIAFRESILSLMNENHPNLKKKIREYPIFWGVYMFIE